MNSASRPYRPARVGALSALAVSLAALPAAAQLPEDLAANRAVLPGETNADIPRALGRARAAARNSDWPEAAAGYVEILEKHAEAVIPQGPGLYAGAADLVLRDLARLPPEGREACRERLEVRAGSLLRAALETRDEEGLWSVLDRYPVTDAAGRAFALLARRASESARSGDAAQLADRLAVLSAERLPPAGVAALVTALARARDRAHLGPLVDRLRRDPSLRDARVRVAAREESLVAFAAAQYSALPPDPRGGAPAEARGAKAGEGVPAAPAGWTQLGGDPTHARLMHTPSASLRRLRTIPIPLPPAVQEGLPNELQPSVYDLPLAPPYFPAIAGDFCYVATDAGVLAYALFDEDAAAQAGAARPAMVEEAEPAWRYDVPPVGGYKVDARATNAVTVHRGRVYASLVTAVTEGEQQLHIYVKVPFPKRALVALDAWTGRRLWQAGGRRDTGDFLSDASFPLPPTPDGDALYAGVTYQLNATDPFSHYVVRLDAETGRLRWKTFVSQGLHEVNLFNNHIRDAVGAAVALRGDTLYYGTNLGCVAALDRLTGRLRWVRKYEQIPIPPPRNVYPQLLPLRWANNPPIVAGGTLCVSPLDSFFAFGLDAETGEERWRLPWGGERGEMWRHFVGVKDGLLFVSGRVLMAIDLSGGGRRRWMFPSEESGWSETGLGKGGVTPDAVLLPTDQGLHRVDPASGRPLAFQPWLRPELESGNVVCADGVLVAASAQAITIYADPETLRASGEAALAQDPDNVLLRYRVGARALAAGRGEEGDRHLRECLRLAAGRAGDPDAARVAGLARRSLFQRYAREAVEAAREAPERARKRLADARPLADDAAAARELLARTGDALREGRHWTAALAVYQELILDEAGEPRAPDPEGRPSPAEGPRPTVGTGAEGRREQAERGIEAILAAAGRDPYAPYEAKARALLDDARRTSSVDRFAAVARAYPNSLAARSAGLEGVALHEAAGAWDAVIDASRVYLREHPDVAESAEALRALASALENRGRLGEAKRVLKQLAGRGKGKTVRVQGRDAPADAYAAERLAQAVYRDVPDGRVAPEIAPPLQAAWVFPSQPAARPPVPAPRPPAGAQGRIMAGGPGVVPLRLLPFPGAEDVPPAGLLLAAEDRNVRALDFRSGEPRWTQALDFLPRAAAAVGETIILVGDNRLVGVRARAGKAEWRYDSRAPFRPFGPAGGLFLVVTSGAGGPGRTEVTAIDPEAGAVSWSTTLAGYPVSELFAYENHVALVTTPPGQVVALDATTGQVEESTTVGADAFSHGVVFLEPDRLALVTSVGRVQCVVPATGRKLWETQLEGQRPAPGVAPAGGAALGLCLLSLPRGGPPRYEVAVLDGTTGKRTVSAGDLPPPGQTAPMWVATDGTAAYLLARDPASAQVTLHAFEKTKSLWRFTPPGAGAGSVFMSQGGTLAGKHLVLPLPRYVLPNGPWLPRVAIVDKATGKLAQDLAPGVESQSLIPPRVEVFNGALTITSESGVRLYGGR